MKFLKILLSLACSLFCTANLPAEPTKVYMIGNSLTDEVKYDDWAELCSEAGSEVVVARKMIPGAPIGWHKDHPAQGFLTKPFGHPEEAFKNHPWDVLTLQPFRSGEAEAALYYANLLWETNPSAKVYVYAQWPDKDKGPDWLKAWQNIRDEYYLPVLAALRETPQGAQTFMIPVGHAMERLEKKAQLGLVPGINSVWELYSDGVHVNNICSYLVGLTYYATIFGEPPIGLPVGGYQGVKGTGADYFEISPELARIIQVTVWQAVTGTAESGVRIDLPPVITLPGLLPAVEKEPYRFALDAALGQAPYTYELTAGNLPAGMEFSPEGLLQGTPATVGNAAFRIRVSDQNGKSSTNDFTLNVVPDSGPIITSTALPALSQGQFINTVLTAKDGNAPLHWSVAEGTLPPGLILYEDGRLTGSPGITGEFTVTLEVRDNDGTLPETDRKTFTGTIAPADSEKVLFVRQATTEIKGDGKLDPSEGWDLKNTLKKVYAGTPNNSIRWDAQWLKGNLWIAVEVTDDAVIASEGWGKPRFTEDSMVFYFDGLNNREDTYNFDDRRIAYGPAEKGVEDRNFNIAPSISGAPRFQRTATGYTMEVSFKFPSIAVPVQLEGKENRDRAYAGSVFGFDMENRDLDTAGGKQSVIGWQGNANNAEDPSGFGTLILQP